jgi:hypothetical protein
VSGGILHAHAVYRDPRLAGLSQEELQALDNLTKKLLPESDAAPDGPHNQIESKPAIEAAETLRASFVNEGVLQDHRGDDADSRRKG